MKVLLLLGTCVKFFVKEVKVLLGTSLSSPLSFYVKVIKIILFYKIKEGGACEEREWKVRAVCAR